MLRWARVSQARNIAPVSGLVRTLIASAKKSSVVSARKNCLRNASSLRRTSAWATMLVASRCNAISILASMAILSMTPVRWRRIEMPR